MNRAEQLFFGLILGIIFPVLFFLIAVSIWFFFFQNLNVHYFVLLAVASGFFIDLFYLKNWIRIRFELPVWILISIYLFYNLCEFGFFMGFPVFNLLMGVIAGYYFGHRLLRNYHTAVDLKRIVRKVSLFTASVMFLICSASAFLATIGEVAGKELGSMLRLPFELTESMVWGIILIGGPVLILAQYLLTQFTINLVIRHKSQAP